MITIDAYIVPIDTYIVTVHAYIVPIDAYMVTIDAYIVPIDAYIVTVDAYIVRVDSHGKVIGGNGVPSRRVAHHPHALGGDECATSR
jgi:hypothetical protein